MKILIGYILTYLYLAIVLIFTTILNKKFNYKEETTRKLIHILVGFSWFIMVYFFKTSYHLIIPPLTFIFINYISYKTNLIKSMERKRHNTKGTIYYALSFTILALITYLMPKFLPYYGIAVLTMALGDGLAPFLGYKLKLEIGNTKKTYSGSLGVFVISILISIFFNMYFNLGYTFFKYFLIGLSSTILEFIGFKGYDNLTLPLGLALITYLL